MANILPSTLQSRTSAESTTTRRVVPGAISETFATRCLATRARSDLFGVDRVNESRGVETVTELRTNLRLGIHQEVDAVALRARQRDVVGVVVRHVVALPSAEERLARGRDLRIRQRKMARGLFEHDLAHVGRIGRHPAVLTEK